MGGNENRFCVEPTPRSGTVSAPYVEDREALRFLLKGAKLVREENIPLKKVVITNHRQRRMGKIIFEIIEEGPVETNVFGMGPAGAVRRWYVLEPNEARALLWRLSDLLRENEGLKGKVRGLEKHVESLESQIRFLQERVRELERALYIYERLWEYLVE